MPAKFKKVSDKEVDRGLYVNESCGSIRVMYQARERINGKDAVVQRTKTFPKRNPERRDGKYLLYSENGTSFEPVEVIRFARDFKMRQDLERHAGTTRDVDRDEMTLGKYWDRFIVRPTAKTGELRRESTLARMDTVWRLYIAPNFAETPLRSITTTDVKDWHSALSCGQASKNKALRTLESILTAAAQEDLCDRIAIGINVTDKVRPITENEVFSDEQIRDLREAVPDRYALMVDFLAYGMRMAEVIGLRRDAVNLKGDVEIRSQVTEVNRRLVEGPPKSENGKRTLHFPHLATEIQRHIERYAQLEDHGFMFTDENREGPIHSNTWRRTVFYPALGKANLPIVNPHVLRHRTASYLAARGYTDTQIAYWLGDTPATVAQVYRHLFDPIRKRIGDDLAGTYLPTRVKA